MTESAKNFHHRRSIRLAEHDYSAEGGYYITIVTQGRVCLFGEINDGVMQLNDYGKIVWEEWFRTARLRPNVELLEDEFVVMPNHIHGIIWLNENRVDGETDIISMNGCSGRGTARCAPTPDRQFGKMIQNSIPVIVRAFKSAATKRINILRNTPGIAVWQRNYYEHIFNSEKDYNNIVNYISSNPINWDSDAENQTH
jgi:putative transposase